MEQERRLVDTANVVGMLRGAEEPDQWVIVGSHHDAWSFGAGDPPEELERANDVLLRMERLWLADGGIPGRPWYRNLYAATDADSGYAPWMLPALRWTLERDRLDRWKEMEFRYLQVFHLLHQQVEVLSALAD